MALVVVILFMFASVLLEESESSKDPNKVEVDAFDLQGRVLLRQGRRLIEDTEELVVLKIHVR